MAEILSYPREPIYFASRNRAYFRMSLQKSFHWSRPLWGNYRTRRLYPRNDVEIVMRDFQKQLVEWRQKAESLFLSQKEMQLDREEAFSQITELASINETLVASNNALILSNKFLEGELDTAAVQTSTIQTQLNILESQQSSDLNTFGQRMISLREAQIDTEQQLSSAQTEKLELDSELSVASKRSDKLEAGLGEYKLVLTHYESRCARLEKALKESRDNVSKLNKEVTTLTERSNKFENDLCDMIPKNQQLEAALDESITARETASISESALRSECAALRVKLQSERQNLTRLESELVERSDELESVGEICRTLESEKQELGESLVQKEKRYEELEALRTDLKESFETTKHELQCKVDECEKLKTTITECSNEYSADLESCREALVDLSTRIDTLMIGEEKLKDENKNLLDENGRLRLKVHQVTEDMKLREESANKQLEEWEKEKSDLMEIILNHVDDQSQKSLRYADGWFHAHSKERASISPKRSSEWNSNTKVAPPPFK
eukprot:983599_1